MHYAFQGYDKPNTNALRQETRTAHLEWVKEQPIPIGGPLLNAEGEMVGSLVICEASSLSEAEALFASDPYAIAGLFESTTITPWKWVIGAPKE